MNNKGQTLAIFVIFIPVIILLGALIVDVGRYAYETNHINQINKLCIYYALDNIENSPKEKTILLLYKNDNDISKYELDINTEQNKVSLYIEKEIKLLFTKVLGKNYFIVKSSYMGYIDNDTKLIRREENNE